MKNTIKKTIGSLNHKKVLLFVVIIVVGAWLASILVARVAPVDCKIQLVSADKEVLKPKPSKTTYDVLRGYNEQCGVTKNTSVTKNTILTQVHTDKVKYTSDMAKIAYDLNNTAGAKEFAENVTSFNKRLSVQQRQKLNNNNLIIDMMMISVGVYSRSIPSLGER